LLESCGRVDNDIQESIEAWGFIICTKDPRNFVTFRGAKRERQSDETDIMQVDEQRANCP